MFWIAISSYVPGSRDLDPGFRVEGAGGRV